jgi:murein DD-endopeptidase MepM/ murein hydrolase activator NlpD
MARRGALALLLAFVVAAPAGADTITERKQSVDQKLAALGESVEQTRQRESALRSEFASAGRRIRALVSEVGDVSARLEALERELALREQRLKRLDALLALQTKRLKLLRTQRELAVQRLNERLVGLYQADETDTLGLLLSAERFTDVLDAIDYLRRIAGEDHRIAEEVDAARKRVRAQRAQTKMTRDRHRQETRVVALRVGQVRALRDRLVASRNELAGTQAGRRQEIASLNERQRAELAEMEALQQVSATLAAKIQAAQTASPGAGAPSAAGFIWPVNGPVTSPFGMRWGRMHEGIDIGAASGTPIRAAAAGTVIYADWLGGYGNLIVIDHGDGVSTAYAHQSGLAAGAGQRVPQGEVIGYVGSTGHSSGPHLHFEVRVNGVPVDPLGYL